MKKLPVFLLALLIATAASASSQAGAQILQQMQGIGSPADSAETTVNNCFVQGVAAFPNRVHILCAAQPIPNIGPSASAAAQSAAVTASGAIGPYAAQATANAAPTAPFGAVRYFAVENNVSENAMALTVLSVANAAMQRNRPLTIVYRSNPNQNPGGCLASDCRRIVGVLLN